INNGNIAGEGEPLILTQVSDGWREDNLLNQGYVLEFIPDPELMRDHFEFNSAYYVQSRNASRTDTFIEDYVFEEDVYATYGMVKHNLDRLMILGGLRYEFVDITRNRGFRAVTDGSRFIALDTLENARTQDFILPQVQLKYELDQYSNIRAAVTQTYAHPNYNAIINAIAIDEDDEGEFNIGNPNLNFATATNFDLLIERYKKSSIFSTGVFYKQIDDFVYIFQGLVRDALRVDPDNPNDVIPTSEVTIALNGKRAEVFGAELQAQFKFDFLPGILSDFGLYTNYTYTSSNASLPSRPEANISDAPLVPFTAEDLSNLFNSRDFTEISLPGQSTHTANLALFYDGPKFFARLSANYQDDFLISIGLDPDFDEYYDEAFRLDYTMNYKLNDHVTFFADWINVTNTPLRFYLGNEQVVKQQEFYSWWCRAGARINF
ncbi:MAG: TonB-dependent receptor, partial [Bacteroidota bacterium]